MTTRTREWLRSFLQLGIRAEKDGIPAADIERQEDTVLRALDLLDEQPGIVLADEVGMGKTYEALGIAAATRHFHSRSRVVVLTPGPDLNRKWFSEFSRFKEMYSFGDDVHEVHGLSDFVEAVREHPVVVAPVSMFQSGRDTGTQTYLLSLYFYWKEIHGHTANAIMARFRDGEHTRVDVTAEKFLGIFDLDQVEPHLRQAFRRGRTESAAGLDDLYEKGGLQAFENQDAVRKALYRARFELTGCLMPLIDLLIVDEAHKLKNPGSLRTNAMQRVFNGRFRKALFLTATPFQLDVSELREVFSLFAGAKDAPKDLIDQVEKLLASVKEYQEHYEEFQRTWSALDPVIAAQFRTAYDCNPADTEKMEEPTLKLVARQITALKKLKSETIEPGFRKWIIRSLREDKREYRRHLPKKLSTAGAGALPFLIYERFIAELFRRRRQTHKAAVEINMVSSYTAAHQGAILASEDGIPTEAEVYRDLLRKILSEIETSTHEHPKIYDVVSNALDAAEKGEKTLIFCSRVATLEQLRRELDTIWESRIVERWRRVYPKAGADEIFDTREDNDKRQRGRHSLLQSRFHRPQDALYLALREPYLRTYVPVAKWALHRLSEVLRIANLLLQDIRVGKTAAERLDYQIAKRCVEQATLRHWIASGEAQGTDSEALTAILDPDYLRFGLDLIKDDFEDESFGDERPQWHISERVARLVLGGGSFWKAFSAPLNQLDRKLRVRVVEQLARYFTYKQVPFLSDLLTEASAAGLTMDSVESIALLEFMPSFWQTGMGQSWMKQLQSFIHYFIQRSHDQQIDILDGPIKTGDFVRHTRDGESREKLREAFNTPLYPMILIANEVMQEGLDLHKHCRRVIHHDLVWNPAQIEQRIGRIDRLGSLTNRLRKNGDDVTLDVLYPVIRGTIDERLFKTVKSREKWLEFLLGAAPNFSEYSLMDEEPPPLPERLCAELSIDLGPKIEKEVLEPLQL